MSLFSVHLKRKLNLLLSSSLSTGRCNLIAPLLAVIVFALCSSYFGSPPLSHLSRMSLRLVPSVV
jgi:hypothetical protein